MSYLQGEIRRRRRRRERRRRRRRRRKSKRKRRRFNVGRVLVGSVRNNPHAWAAPGSRACWW
jgi:hypothetical protein